jgi:hypothetical protein
MKLAFKIIRNLIRYYWHIIIAVVLILWVILSYIAGFASWKAVFLDNDQVYFGHYVHLPFAQFGTLRNVYMLKPGDTPDEPSTIAPIIREPHGPQDSIKINIDHITEIQILRSDSSLVKTIEGAYKNQ